MPSLLLGCGHDRRKKVYHPPHSEWVQPLVTLDFSPLVKADFVHDLEDFPWPFKDEEFNEIGAFDVLEHFGRQGDWRRWFKDMGEIHRILKPNGTFHCLVPVGRDALADPGHTRFIHRNHFVFLNQQQYDLNLKAGNPMTDYRWYWKLNFEIEYLEEIEGHHLATILRKA